MEFILGFDDGFTFNTKIIRKCLTLQNPVTIFIFAALDKKKNFRC